MEKNNIEELSLTEFLNLDSSSLIYKEYLEYAEYYRCAKKKVELDRYNEIVEYHLIIDQIIEYLLNNTDNEVLSVVSAINDLINKYNIFGKISYDDKTYDEDILGNYGITITLGKGCCRNLASFYNDILSRMGYDSNIVRVRTLNDGYINTNHMCITFKYNDNILLLDPTSYNIFNVIGLYACSITDDNVYTISPCTYILENNMTIDEIKENIIDQGKGLSIKNKAIILNELYKVNNFDINVVNDLKIYISPSINEIKSLRKHI